MSEVIEVEGDGTDLPALMKQLRANMRYVPYNVRIVMDRVVRDAKFNCPVRTGETRDSLRLAVWGNEFMIEGNAAAQYVEQGHTTTRGLMIPGKWFIRDAYDAHRAELKYVIKLALNKGMRR